MKYWHGKWQLPLTKEISLVNVNFTFIVIFSISNLVYVCACEYNCIFIEFTIYRVRNRIFGVHKEILPVERGHRIH